MKTYTEQELRAKDAWIAEHVMGWTDIEFYHPQSEFMEEAAPPFWRGMHKMCLLWQSVPLYHSDPAAAMQVLEKCCSWCCVEVGEYGDVHKSKIGYFARSVYQDIIAEAPTLPLAIVLFAEKLFGK